MSSIAGQRGWVGQWAGLIEPPKLGGWLRAWSNQRYTCAGRSECSIKWSARTLAVTTDIRASDLHTLAIIVASAFVFAHRTLDPFLPSAHTSGRVSIIILLYALYSVESAICGAFSVHVSVVCVETI